MGSGRRFHEVLLHHRDDVAITRMATLNRTSRPRRATCGSLLLIALAAIVASGCGVKPYKGPPYEDAMKAKIDPSLPLIDLPKFDLGQPVPSPSDDPVPAALGHAIPASDFSIRVAATRPAVAKGDPHPLVFHVLTRTAEGELVVTANCFLKPVPQQDGSIQYEGTCPEPVSHRSSIIDIRWREKSYLVRSVEIR
jgi:hypothetical protein